MLWGISRCWCSSDFDSDIRGVRVSATPSNFLSKKNLVSMGEITYEIESPANGGETTL